MMAENVASTCWGVPARECETVLILSARIQLDAPFLGTSSDFGVA